MFFYFLLADRLKMTVRHLLDNTSSLELAGWIEYLKLTAPKE